MVTRLVRFGSGARHTAVVYFVPDGRAAALHLARCAFGSQQQALTVDDPQPGISGWRAVSRTLRSTSRTLLDPLSTALFPAGCALCGDALPRLTRAPVCDACWLDLPAQSGSLCLCCGEALGAHAFAGADRAPGDWLCRPCRVSPPRFERAVAYGLYRGTLRDLLHLLKYEGMEPVALRLGQLLAAQVAALPALPTSLTVVPVPLWAAKQRDRGYNQAELLGRALVQAGRRQGLDWKLDCNALRRKRATESQAGLSPRQRRHNVRTAFFVPGARRDPAYQEGGKPSREMERLKGRDLLLVDDIYTTGATARATAAALREAGAASVWVATVARAQRLEHMPPVMLPMEEDVAFWS